MLQQLLLAGALTLTTTAIHGLCTTAVLHTVSRLHVGHWAMRSMNRAVLSIGAVVMLMLLASVIEAAIWAAAYLQVGAIEGLEPALYFSIVTFTTLGYGEIVLGQNWRLLASLQAATGIVLFGWTTALVIAFVQRVGDTVRAGRLK